MLTWTLIEESVRKSLTVIIGAWILLSACQPSPPAEEQAVPSDPVVVEQEQSAPEPSAQVQDGQEQPVQEDQEQAVSVSPSPAQVRTALAATDPATVDLNSGTPKLVEFFAFW
jgi:hypothetical protein